MLFTELFHPLCLLALAVAAAAGEDECSDTSSPQCCYEAHKKWALSKHSFEQPTTAVVNYTVTVTRETYSDVPTTTLCDGFLRYLGPQTGDYYDITVPADEPVTTSFSTPYPIPSPACTIDEDACLLYTEEYASSVETWRSNTSLPSPARPPCTTYSSCPGDGEGMCKMDITSNKIYYWPVTVEGDLCGDRTTITHPEPTRSTVISGATFVSPSLYLSIGRLRAYSAAGKVNATACGRHKTDVLLAIDPTDASTRYGIANRYRTSFRPLDLADLNEPTPVTAYFGFEGAPDCEAAPENCTETIDASPFPPRLSAPVQMFRELDPEYEFCELHPTSRSGVPDATWIPLEPSQDWWPEPTGEAEGEGEESESETAVTQVISTTQTFQDSRV